MELTNYNPCSAQAEDIKKVFNFLSSEEIEEICPYLELREWQADAVVMKEGEFENYMGFVTEGKLAVKKETGFWGKHIIIGLLDKGTMVGEGAFIDQGPRSTTVVAMEATKILILEVPKMDELIEDKPMLAIKLMKRILYILSVRLRKAGDRISELL